MNIQKLQLNKLKKFICIQGVKFLNGGYESSYNMLSKGGLMVIPAAPALNQIDNNEIYYDSIKNSDFAITDSGYMIILLRILRNIKLSKI